MIVTCLNLMVQECNFETNMFKAARKATDLSHTQKKNSNSPYPFQSKSISTGAQYVTLDNKIKCLSLAFFFWQPHQ
jgi:hypothetical protein